RRDRSWHFSSHPHRTRTRCGACRQPQRRTKREQFVEELLTAVPVYAVNMPIALRAGQLDGHNQARGVRVPLPDLLIGVTALELGYSVGTANLRHFQQVPGLSVVQL